MENIYQIRERILLQQLDDLGNINTPEKKLQYEDIVDNLKKINAAKRRDEELMKR